MRTNTGTATTTCMTNKVRVVAASAPPAIGPTDISANSATATPVKTRAENPVMVVITAAGHCRVSFSSSAGISRSMKSSMALTTR